MEKMKKLHRSILLLIVSSVSAQVTLTPVFDSPVSPPPFELLSPATYAICYDLDMSPYAGGEDLLFATRLFEKATTYIGSKTPAAYEKTMVARTLRLSELLLIYFPLNVFTSVVQHEVFGHGYRIRDIDHGIVKVEGYHFDFPPPYGSGDGETAFTLDTDRISTTDLACISMAGFEAQWILAQQTKLKWLESHTIDPRQTILYLVSLYELSLYASHNKMDADLHQSHDVAGYVIPLNLTYTDAKLKISHLKNLGWINLADPFTYYSLFAWFHYLSSGRETKIPMIPIKDYGYLFGAHLGLTPFGPEYFIDNYLLKEDRPIYFYVKGGNHARNTYLGGGCFAPRIWNFHHWSLGTRLDIWKQPELLLFEGRVPLAEFDYDTPNEEPLYSSKQQHAEHYGFAASLITAYRAKPWVGFQCELGYKSAGFLPGYSLYPSPVVRVSYLAHF